METSSFYVMPFRSSTRKYSSGRVRKVKRSRPGMQARPGKVAVVYRRPRYARTSKALGAKWANPMALTRQVKFRYADHGWNLTTGISGAPTIQVFRSSPFDPDVTGSGVQPYDWDTLMTATDYSRYSVMAAKISVVFTFSGAANTVICSVVPTRTATLSYFDSADLRAMPGCRQGTLNEITKGRLVLSSYINFSRFVGRSWKDFITAYNADPGVGGIFYWHVITDSTNMSTAVGVNVDVSVTFYTRIMRTDTVNES